MYVTWDYFSNTYLGTGVLETEFPRLLARAEELIDEQTRYQIAKNGLDSFDETVQTLIKKAVCSQVEYYGEYGLNVGFGADDTGFTVGKVSVQAPSGAGGAKLYLCPRALSYLEQTGLLSRRVGVIC